MELLLNYNNKHNKEIEINFNKINETNNSFIFNVDPNLIGDVMFSLGSFFSTNRIKNTNDKMIDFIDRKNKFNTNVEKELIRIQTKKYNFNDNEQKENIKLKRENDTFLISEKYLKYKKNVFTIFGDGTFIKGNEIKNIFEQNNKTNISKTDPIFKILKEYDSIDKNNNNLKINNENLGMIKGNFYIFINEFKSEMFIFNNISEDILKQELQIIKPSNDGTLNITKLLIADNVNNKNLIKKDILRIDKEIFNDILYKDFLNVERASIKTASYIDIKEADIDNKRFELNNALKFEKKQMRKPLVRFNSERTNKAKNEFVLSQGFLIEKEKYKQTSFLKRIDTNKANINKVSIKSMFNIYKDVQKKTLLNNYEPIEKRFINAASIESNESIKELNNRIAHLNKECVIEKEQYKEILNSKDKNFDLNNKNVFETKSNELNKKRLQEILIKNNIRIDQRYIKNINEFKINSINFKNTFTNVDIVNTDKLERKDKFDILNYSYNSFNKFGGESTTIENIESVKRKLDNNINTIKFNSFIKFNNDNLVISKDYSVLKSKPNDLLYLNLKLIGKTNRNELTITEFNSVKKTYNNNMYIAKIESIISNHNNDMNVIKDESLINIYNNKLSVLDAFSLNKLNNNSLKVLKGISLDKNKKYFLNNFSVLSLETKKKQNLNRIKLIEASHKDDFVLNINPLIIMNSEHENSLSRIDFKSISNVYDRNIQLNNITSSNKKWKPLNDFDFESLNRIKGKIVNADKIASAEKMYLDNINIDYQESLTEKYLNTLNILNFNAIEKEKYNTALVDKLERVEKEKHNTTLVDITERVERLYLDSVVINEFKSTINISGRNTLIGKFEKVNLLNAGSLNIIKRNTVNKKDNNNLLIDEFKPTITKSLDSLSVLNFDSINQTALNKLYINSNETINKVNGNSFIVNKNINIKKSYNNELYITNDLYIERDDANLILNELLPINQLENSILNIFYDNLNIFKIPDYDIHLDEKYPLLTKENKKIRLFSYEKLEAEKDEIIIYEKIKRITKEKYSAIKFNEDYKLDTSNKEIGIYNKMLMLKSEYKEFKKYDENTILDFKNKLNLKVKSEEIFLNKMPKSMMLYYNQKTVTKNSIKDLNKYEVFDFVGPNKKDTLMYLETLIFDAKNNKNLKITSGKNAYDKRSLDTILENENVIYQKIRNNFIIFDLYSAKKASNKNIMLDEDIEVLDDKILNITFFNEMKKLNLESKDFEIYNKTEIEKVYKNKNFSLNSFKIISNKKENELKEYNNLTLESFGKNFKIYNNPLRIYSNYKDMHIVEEIKKIERDFKSLNKIKEFELLNITLEGTDINVEDLKNLLSEKKYKSILMNIDIFVENSMPDGYNKFFRNITDDGFDELLLPKTDFDYSDFLSKVLDDEGNPIDPVRETDDGEFIVKMPVSHPMENVYEDVQKDFLLVDVSILKYMIEATYFIWKENIFVFGATDMKASIIDLMDRLNKVVMFKIPTDLKPQAYRVLRLIRWYAEAAIINNAEYKIVREYAENKSAMFNGKLNLEHEKENLYVDSQLYMLSLINRSEDASLTLNIENHKDGYVTFGYQKTSSGILKILLNDVLITDYKNEDSKIEIFIEKGSNVLKIEFINNESDSIFRIANIITPFTKFVDARTEYIADRSKGNLVIDEMLRKASIYTNVLDDNAEFVNQLIEGNIAIGDLIDRLINYYNKHHLGKKRKGKRKIIKK